MMKNNYSVQQQSHTRVRRHSLPLRQCRPKWCSNGFHIRSILLWSLASTVFGIILFRLATANTHNIADVKFFSIVGSLFATIPWIVQIVVSASIILLYNAGVCDLNWFVTSSVDHRVASQDQEANFSENAEHGTHQNDDNNDEDVDQRKKKGSVPIDGDVKDSHIVSLSEPVAEHAKEEH